MGDEDVTSVPLDLSEVLDDEDGDIDFLLEMYGYAGGESVGSSSLVTGLPKWLPLRASR